MVLSLRSRDVGKCEMLKSLPSKADCEESMTRTDPPTTDTSPAPTPSTHPRRYTIDRRRLDTHSGVPACWGPANLGPGPINMNQGTVRLPRS